MKEINPDMIVTRTEPVGVFQGHAFVVEAAVSLGGSNMPAGVTVHRCGNGNCCVRTFALLTPHCAPGMRIASRCSSNKVRT